MQLFQFETEEQKTLKEIGFLRVEDQNATYEYNMPNPLLDRIRERHIGTGRSCIWTEWEE